MWWLSFVLLLAGFCCAQNLGLVETSSVSSDKINEVANSDMSSSTEGIFTNREPSGDNVKDEPIHIPPNTEELNLPAKPDFLPIPTEEVVDPTQKLETPEVSEKPKPVPIENDVTVPETEPKPEKSACQKRNSYYKIDGSCDAYIECREFIPRNMLCPDGMHYNPDTKWPEYPCGYPMDVTCTGRGFPQEASPTEHCPHRYGFYPPLESDPNDCGRYRMCVDGNSIDMNCPPGLAFNPEINRCDWPEKVPTCNVEGFLGFKCPAHPVDLRGQPLDLVLNFRHEKDCHIFYSCKKGRARLLSCDIGFAFDPLIGKCVDSDFVACPYDPINDDRKIFF